MLISLDISTSVIGISSFDESDGKLIELDYIKFKSGSSIFEKLSAFKEKIKHWRPLLCPCRNCRVYIDGVGFI